MQIIKGMETEYADYVRINSEDDYSRGVVTYTERWADLMEAGMADGENLIDIAHATSHTADVEGITGFMYGCAVSALARFWEHGETLRLWHNGELSPAQADEVNSIPGAVLNPALITYSVPEDDD